MSWYRTLTEMRQNGWTVAVHNDYSINGSQRTFWLLTHVPSGLFVKGEGETDEVAVLECARQARQVFRPSP